MNLVTTYNQWKIQCHCHEVRNQVADIVKAVFASLTVYHQMESTMMCIESAEIPSFSLIGKNPNCSINILQY